MSVRIQVTDTELLVCVSLAPKLCELCGRRAVRIVNTFAVAGVEPERLMHRPLHTFVEILDEEKWHRIYSSDGSSAFACPECSEPVRAVEKKNFVDLREVSDRVMRKLKVVPA